MKKVLGSEKEKDDQTIFMITTQKKNECELLYIPKDSNVLKLHTKVRPLLFAHVDKLRSYHLNSTTFLIG